MKNQNVIEDKCGCDGDESWLYFEHQAAGFMDALGWINLSVMKEECPLHFESTSARMVLITALLLEMLQEVNKTLSVKDAATLLSGDPLYCWAVTE